MANIHKEIDWLIEEKYKGKINTETKKDIERLKKGEPIDYIIGWVNLLGCKIDLSRKPLIPRPETEYWTEKVIKEIPESNFLKNRKLEILDIFAGSGCIGIAVLKHIKNAKVDFAEKEKKFLEQIKINLKINKISPQKYRLIQSDIFRNINKKYDIIFANPPYIAFQRKKFVQKSVLKFEPNSAIFAKEKGLFHIKEFLKQVPNYLKKKGIFYMEFDSWQKKEIEKLLRKHKFKNYHFFKDQYKRWRLLKARV